MLVPVSMYKAEKYAVDMHVLDEKTRTFFLRNFGCARKVYNLYVDYLYNALEKEGYVSGNSIPKISFPVSESVFKKMYPYLKEADSLGLMNTRLSFETALKNIWKTVIMLPIQREQSEGRNPVLSPLPSED